MSEITTKKLSEYTESELRAMLPQYAKGYKKVTSLPATIDEGEIISYNGALYRGLLATETSLPVGTPWPVCGFKEAVGYLTSSGSALTVTVSRSHLSAITAVRTNTGQYYLECADFKGEGLVQLQVSHFGTHGSTGQYFMTLSYGNSNNRLFIRTYAVSAGVASASDAAFAISYFTLRVYPPYAPPPTPPVGN